MIGRILSSVFGCPTIAADQSLNELLRGVDPIGAVRCAIAPHRWEGEQHAGDRLPVRSSEPGSHEGRGCWEAALNWPLPPRPGFYLLDEARRHVITYLDWVTHDLARGPSPDELRREIERAAGRLLEIALALRDLLDDGDGAM